LEILVDGLLWPRAGWNAPLPIDRGHHVVQARAPNRKSFQTELETTDRERYTVHVPTLESVADAAPLAPPTSTNTTTIVHERSTVSGASSGSGLRVAGVVVGGVGLVSLGVAGFFGLSAQNTYDSGRSECSAKNVCTQTGADSGDKAEQKALIATVTGGVGVVAVATGLVLWFVGGSSSGAEKKQSLSVSTPPSPLGLAVAARF